MANGLGFGGRRFFLINYNYYERLVGGGGRGWVSMGRTPRLGFRSVLSSLVVFMKGWWEGEGDGFRWGGRLG